VLARMPDLVDTILGESVLGSKSWDRSREKRATCNAHSTH
jgi:hypothetical protein